MKGHPPTISIGSTYRQVVLMIVVAHYSDGFLPQPSEMAVKTDTWQSEGLSFTTDNRCSFD